MTKKQLLGGLPRKPFQCLESVAPDGGSGLVRMRGVFQNYTETNLNNRVYPRPIWDKHLAEDSEFSVRRKNRLTLGLIEHPADGITDLGKAAIVITEVAIATPEEIAASNGQLHEGDIIGTLEILPTPQGQILKALTEANIPWGVSSRGNGSIIEGRGGPDTVDTDFQLETWDAVFSPSVARAIPSLMTESVGSRASKIALLENTWPDSIAPAASTAPAHTTPAAAASVPAPTRSTPTPPSPAHNPTPAPSITERKMNPLTEIRRLKINLAEMASRSTKNMKPSDKSVIFEQLDEMRISAQRLANEDNTLKPLAEEININAMNLAKRLDEENEPTPPPPAADAPPPPPAADAPPPPSDVDGDGDDDSAQVVSDLETAADLLRSVGSDEANASADALEALADRVADLDPDALPDDMPTDADIGSMPVESRRVIAGLQRRLRVANNSLQSLGESAQRLLTKHTALVKGGGALVDGHPASEWATAAREVTEEYNKECLSLGRAFMKATAPDLYEAHKDQLDRFTNYRRFVKFVERVKAQAAGTPPVTERRQSPPSRPVTEGRKPAQPAPTSKPQPPAVVEAHPDVLFLNRQRKAING